LEHSAAEDIAMTPELIYFDNAATTFPKPPEVIRAVTATMRYSGGNPGRGSHRLARSAADILYDCREEIADFLGLKDPAHVIFTQNTTHALNTAIKGLLRPLDHVLISDMEHNSVLRPIAAMQKSHRISYSVFSTAALQEQSDDAVERELSRHLCARTRAVICAQASNLTSRALPVSAIGHFCRKHSLLLIVDAAQSLGHLPIHMADMGITALCAPGHKGAYGPQGSGFLLLSDELDQAALPLPLMEGGSGYQSLLPEMPELPPERYEAGTVSTPMIAGLHAGLRFIRRIGIEEIRAHEEQLFSAARDILLSFPEIKIYDSNSPGSVLSFTVDGRRAEEIAALLDGDGICTRAGFHCTALAHKTLRTPPESGAVRLGFGYFNTPSQVHRLYPALKRILG
jgi:cysteine desulfurase family protein